MRWCDQRRSKGTCSVHFKSNWLSPGRFALRFERPLTDWRVAGSIPGQGQVTGLQVPPTWEGHMRGAIYQWCVSVTSMFISPPPPFLPLSPEINEKIPLVRIFFFKKVALRFLCQNSGAFKNVPLWNYEVRLKQSFCKNRCRVMRNVTLRHEHLCIILLLAGEMALLCSSWCYMHEYTWIFYGKVMFILVKEMKGNYD